MYSYICVHLHAFVYNCIHSCSCLHAPCRSYVCAHAYMPSAIKRAVHCGVRSIEHGNFLDEETAALMAQQGTFLVPTLVTYQTS